jgi:hypothetical protein
MVLPFLSGGPFAEQYMAWVALPLMLYMGEMQEQVPVQVPVQEHEPVQVPVHEQEQAPYRYWEIY